MSDNTYSFRKFFFQIPQCTILDLKTITNKAAVISKKKKEIQCGLLSHSWLITCSTDELNYPWGTEIFQSFPFFFISFVSGGDLFFINRTEAAFIIRVEMLQKYIVNQYNGKVYSGLFSMYCFVLTGDFKWTYSSVFMLWVFCHRRLCNIYPRHGASSFLVYMIPLHFLIFAGVARAHARMWVILGYRPRARCIFVYHSAIPVPNDPLTPLTLPYVIVHAYSINLTLRTNCNFFL